MKNLMIRPSRMDVANQIENLFGDFWRWPFVDRQMDGFVPATDIEETEKDFRIVFELPGMEKNDIKVSVEDNVLTVSGERKERSEEKNKNFVRSEIRCGSFSRSFSLPRTVDVQNVAADYKDGLLTITLQKTEEAKPKEIEIKVK
jgi:HSP20 family protein